MKRVIVVYIIVFIVAASGMDKDDCNYGTENGGFERNGVETNSGGSMYYS